MAQQNLPTGSGVDIDPAMMKPQRGNGRGAVVVSVFIVALGVGLLVFGLRASGEKMTVEQRMEIQKNLFVLPAKEQIPKWRKWAADDNADKDLRTEALSQLAFLNDPEGVKLAVKGLADPSHKIRGTCAQVLAHYGSPTADSGKPALLKALEKADASDKRQIVWALVELKAPSVFDVAMNLYRTGELTTVERLEGGRAFDPVKVAKLVSLDKLVSRVGDKSAAIRQLIATILSENADKKYTDVLIKLVQDDEIVVAREAASGLGRIGDEKARAPLVAALKKADKDSRLKFLQALRDGIGGEGLVLALDTVATEPEATNWFQMRQLFDMMHMLADPRVGDSLVAWVEKNKPFIHWETEAGIVMAEIGDVRGAKFLGNRMGKENKDIYIKEKFWQADAGGHLTRTDRPRVISARMLSDLAVAYPDKKQQLDEWAGGNVLHWCTSRPQPHANALRFLAAVGNKKAIPIVRDWAFPKDKLPVEGAQPPFPMAYETAQSALRYIGWMRDGQSLDKLLDQFDRKKDAKMDITQAGLEGAGLAMLGMALRAVTYGAANGLAQWGQDTGAKATDKLIEFIEDKTWHEEARERACAALGWVADDETIQKVVEKIGEFAASQDRKEQFIGACYSLTLTRRPVPHAVPMMVDLLDAKLEVSIRVALGRAIGVAGVAKHPDAVAKLFEKLKDPELRNAAALALILGGDGDIAARTVATYSGKDDKLALNSLKDHYFRAFGYWSDRDLDSGNIYRWVANANAISRVKLGGAPQEWGRQRLKAQFDNLVFDNGPHSETRVVLRLRLMRAAREGDAKAKKGAMETLEFMKEQGVLMALKAEKGETGTLAAAAFHRLMNPRLVEQESLKELQEESKGK